MTAFKDLKLSAPLLRALEDEQHHQATPVQMQAIPALLRGKDILACAQTGTGKTAAFALPTLQRLSLEGRSSRSPRALVLTPTRELAAQVAERFAAYGRHTDVRNLVIFGGVNENPQIRGLKRGTDVLVATPGRLLDLLGRGLADLSKIEVFVLDEADRMLDMGFIRDIRRIMEKLPRKRQNLLFSATMPTSITSLARSFMPDPVRVDVSPKRTTVESVEQSLLRMEKSEKKGALIEMLRKPEVERSIVFTRTKHGANKLTRHLEKAGIQAAAIHGNKSQNARQKALASFKSGSITVLVATDIAARGIDVDEVTHVFNYELPREPESYVHRIGRTGRAGRTGIAISLCEPAEADNLRAIERLIGFSLSPDGTQTRLEKQTRSPRPKGSTDAAKPKNAAARRRRRNRRPRRPKANAAS